AWNCGRRTHGQLTTKRIAVDGRSAHRRDRRLEQPRHARGTHCKALAPRGDDALPAGTGDDDPGDQEESSDHDADSGSDVDQLPVTAAAPNARGIGTGSKSGLRPQTEQPGNTLLAEAGLGAGCVTD